MITFTVELLLFVAVLTVLAAVADRIEGRGRREARSRNQARPWRALR